MKVRDLFEDDNDLDDMISSLPQPGSRWKFTKIKHLVLSSGSEVLAGEHDPILFDQVVKVVRLEKQKHGGGHMLVYVKFEEHFPFEDRYGYTLDSKNYTWITTMDALESYAEPLDA